MKPLLTLLLSPTLLGTLLLLRLTAPAAEVPEDNRTLSPYFVVQGVGEKMGDSFPLKSTEVKATIAGIIADVHVTQVYANAGGQPLEATYVFPGSTRAAVYGLEMTIGERLLTAKIQPRAEARQTYEQAKAEGRSASLLEQHRPNVFQMNVANILPGDTIRVELHYTELLVPTAGQYEFVYPTVVGPRYSNQPSAGAPPEAKWVQNPFMQEGETTPTTFRLQVELLSGLPIRELVCPSHPLEPQFQDASRATVQWNGGIEAGNNRDFILHYRLAGNKIESGLLLARGETENFFLLTMQPPKPGQPQPLPPREYIFVLDVSGSMAGFPLNTARELMRQLFQTLRPGDTFNVLLFSGGSKLLAPESLPATAQNLAQAFHVIEHETGRGGTELQPALQQAYDLPKTPGTARSVVVVTDGFIDAEPGVLALIARRLGQANLFSFGIGSSVNRYLIEAMAHAGQGEPFVVTQPGEAAAQVAKLRAYIGAPLLTGATVKFEGLETYDVDPLVVPDLLAERPVVRFGKWRGTPRGTITLQGTTGAGPYRQELKVESARMLEGTQALGYLWARQRIARLADFEHLRTDAGRVREITTLGLTYHLLTAHTSFVAVDTVVRHAGGQQATTAQPSPLPQGVSNSAVGAPVSTTPEPSCTLLLLAVLGLAGCCRLRARRLPCA